MLQKAEESRDIAVQLMEIGRLLLEKRGKKIQEAKQQLTFLWAHASKEDIVNLSILMNMDLGNSKTDTDKNNQYQNVLSRAFQAKKRFTR